MIFDNNLSGHDCNHSQYREKVYCQIVQILGVEVDFVYQNSNNKNKTQSKSSRGEFTAGQDDLRWKAAISGRQPLIEDNLLWMTNFAWQNLFCKFVFLVLIWEIWFNRFGLVQSVPRNKYGSVDLVCIIKSIELGLVAS